MNKANIEFFTKCFKQHITEVIYTSIGDPIDFNKILDNYFKRNIFKEDDAKELKKRFIEFKDEFFIEKERMDSKYAE